nr:DUF3037 domain-containing protein [Streptomyces sp. CBG30]
MVFEYAAPAGRPPGRGAGECFNAGVIVYCRAHSFVAARTHLDEAKLRALDPDADVVGVRAALRAVEGVCGGGEEPGRRPVTIRGRRFRWLIAPRSTVVQPGPCTIGLTTDPAGEVERLLDLLVR